jgi:hypothetical protein
MLGSHRRKEKGKRGMEKKKEKPMEASSAIYFIADNSSFQPSEVQVAIAETDRLKLTFFHDHWVQFIWFHQSQFVDQRKSCVYVRRW